MCTLCLKDACILHRHTQKEHNEAMNLCAKELVQGSKTKRGHWSGRRKYFTRVEQSSFHTTNVKGISYLSLPNGTGMEAYFTVTGSL